MVESEETSYEDYEDYEDYVAALSRLYGPKVNSVARRFADDPADLEDLTQDIWTRIVRGLPSKRPESPMEGWIHVLSVNVAHEWVRSRERWHAVVRQVRAHQTADEQYVQPDPNLMDPDAELRMWKAVYDLPPLQRDVVILSIFEEYTVPEVAATIARAQGTVKSSLHRGLAKLRLGLSDLEVFWKLDEL
jgi:RNA polymerase sigma-70 factor (ECF subfamily)